MLNSYVLPEDIHEILRALGPKANEFSGRTVLLTGGAGFLGRYFVETFRALNQQVLTEPCQVVVADNLITAPTPQLRDDPWIEFHQWDVTQSAPQDFPRFDFILHAAGIASPAYYRKYPLQTLQVAVQGTQNLLERARQDESRFLYFSSSEIYGDPDPKNVPTQESYRGNVSCLGPRACYDESKRVGETLTRIFQTQFQTRTRIVRPFNVFGPGMQERDYRVLPNFASQIKSGKALSVYGTGEQTRTFCYITDAINGFLRVLLDGQAGEAYNIGNPKPEISMNQLVQVMEELMNRKIALNHLEYPASYPGDEPMRRCPDITKAAREVGYEPWVDLRTGLKKFFDWTESNYQGT